MNETKYRLVFKGQIAEGARIEDVKEKLAEFFKTDISKFDNLFSGGTKIVKKDSDLNTCEKIKTAFEKAGAICFVEKQNAIEKNTSESTPSNDEAPSPPPLPPPLPNDWETNHSEAKGNRPVRRADEKFCGSCGNIIKLNALACPYCGKTLKKEGLGCAPTAAIAVGVGFVALAIIGILAAIAIPQFVSYRNRAYEATINTELNNLLMAENTYYNEYATYTAKLEALQFVQNSPQVAITIISADENCFEAKGTHDQYSKEIWVDCEGLKGSISSEGENYP